MMSYSYASTNHYQQVLVEFINTLNLPLMTVPDCKDHKNGEIISAMQYVLL